MQVRRAVQADVTVLHRLINSAYRGDTAKLGWTHEADMLAGQRIDHEMLEQLLSDPDQNLLVASDGTEIAGCVNVAKKGSFAYLGLLTVEPRRQGQGLGKALAQAGEALARELGLTAMTMTVIRHRPELIAWYERLGYTNTHKREAFPMDQPRFGTPLRDDLEFVVLEKSL